MKIHLDSKLILYFILVILGASAFLFSVFLPSPTGFYATIAVASLVGFGVCLNIFDTKRSGKQLVCPTGSDCNAVVNSRYSVFFGISLEYWGMVYFALMFISYLGLIFFKESFGASVISLIVLFSVSAGLFSLYLLFVQAILIKKWCMWCILTAFLSLSIFSLSFISLDLAVNFLREYSHILDTLNFLGFALGLGGILAIAISFFKFLDDANIDNKELNAIKELSEFIWFGFGLVLITKFALFISYPEMISRPEQFFGMIVLLVSVVSGAILMIIYAPFLIYMPFEKTEDGKSFRNLRKPAALLGSVAASSWIFAFIVSIYQTEISLQILSYAYAIVIAISTIITLVWERSLDR